ncbi:DUF1254 domain-containing protein [Diaminobutyricibacter tongyongensis]|uniref:DUF1254 domain-containing protein n=1 Tax=Leifsonia tongyongensis TaxID=1268043 RepID=A0A6L9XYR4_9MICO|nr:DUF1254 domain-containing protein [Diaminobutyricibacter tongyongensis]NEN06128.1 DUF1254 domain-containing protein [Diaminobutyricibacter tongyongensis]
MNRLILKYATPLTALVLVVFAWVVYRRVATGSDIVVLAVTGVVVWAIVTPAFIILWPRLTVGGFKRAILRRGLGGGPIPVNTLYAEPSVSSASASNGSLMGTGTDDLLYIAGWLDLRNGPRVLHVPEMAGRYYSVQFTDPSSGANFAYVGTRTTGTEAGDYVLCGPGWTGTAPSGMTRIASPNHSVLVIGRVFVASERDQPVAYALAQQIQLSPLA